MNIRLTLVLGGARSGKTRHAERLVESSGLNPIYIATGEPRDNEMRDRIERHQSDRANSILNWTTIEEPLNLGSQISRLAQPGNVLMIDCLTLWLSNCLLKESWHQSRQDFFQALTSLIDNEKQSDASPSPDTPDCEIIFVSNETGLGVVPMGEISRKFVDESGFLHQELAQLADQVTLVVAGIPTLLKTNIEYKRN